MRSTTRIAAPGERAKSFAVVYAASIEQIAGQRVKELNEYKATAEMSVLDAGMAWLETRKPFIGKRTAKDYAWYIVQLAKQFGDVPLKQLANSDLIRAYQVERMKRVCPSIIRKECSIIIQLLKRVRLWAEVAPFYEPVPLPVRSPGRAMAPDEERRLWEVGKINPKWARAYYLSLLSANTAAGPGELLGLRFRDVSVENPETASIYIQENVKNKGRVREVPLNGDALAAVLALLELAKADGAGLPEHYLTPYREKMGEYDPTRAGQWPKTSFREMCAAANVRMRPYDLRHHGLTKLAEKFPEQVVIKIAGHASPQMLRKIYAHLRQSALREAVNSISSVNRARPIRHDTPAPAPTVAESPEQTMFRVSRLAEQLGIPADKAFQLLIEYERQQALTKSERKNNDRRNGKGN
jgi:integrase